eukprot:TRINITY_DN21703_c0_g1_i1.p1 TRINITY_DN21703_c0_g1~~TRINITY_DN21703_c0_g1_i1.p1  ORF type:complete len:195 (+),score=44.04 TRINITY_DN21703_c0_g1_i1:83-667(+)
MDLQILLSDDLSLLASEQKSQRLSAVKRLNSKLSFAENNVLLEVFEATQDRLLQLFCDASDSVRELSLCIALRLLEAVAAAESSIASRLLRPWAAPALALVERRVQPPATATASTSSRPVASEPVDEVRVPLVHLATRLLAAAPAELLLLPAVQQAAQRTAVAAAGDTSDDVKRAACELCVVLVERAGELRSSG